MGTNYQIKYTPDAKVTAPALVKIGIDSVLTEINRQMSTYLPDSEISRFNRSESLVPMAVPMAQPVTAQAVPAVAPSAPPHGKMDVGERPTG